LLFIGVAGATLAYQLGFGTLHHPGSGFFPFWLSLILAVVSFIHIRPNGARILKRFRSGAKRS